jgi:hypothetical protein
LQHHKADPHEAGLCGEPGGGRARFQRELRELRAKAGLGHAELAARAHYPCDVIRAAEAGPSLPSLPVLSAYVRACGGTTVEWEERWRSLTSSPASPLLPARPVGESEAATAGARVGTAPPVGDGHDPALIMAALGRVADGIATDSSSPSAAVASYGTAGVTTCSPEPAPSAGTLPGWAAASAASPSYDVYSSGAASLSGAMSLPGSAPSATHADRPGPAADSPDNATLSLVPAPTVSHPQGGFPESASGQTAGSRRLVPSRMALAALVVILCLATALLALFA